MLRWVSNVSLTFNVLFYSPIDNLIISGRRPVPRPKYILIKVFFSFFFLRKKKVSILSSLKIVAPLNTNYTPLLSLSEMEGFVETRGGRMAGFQNTAVPPPNALLKGGAFGG